jgi:hypothetical protein
MTRPPLRPVLGLVFSLAPLGVGLFRAMRGGGDYRLLWMALAAFVGARLAVMVRTRRPSGTRDSSLASWATVIATVFAGATGYLLGARNPVGVWMVAVVVGAFSAVGAVLLRRRAS